MLGANFAAREHGFRPSLTATGVVAAVMFALSPAPYPSAEAAVAITKCGAPINSTVRSFGNGTLAVTSASFVNVPQASAVINVPSGQTHCVRVRFSAIGECTLANPPTDHLFFRVTDNGNVGSFFPASAAYISSSNQLDTSSFEWAIRLSQGSHTIRMQTVVDGGDSCSVFAWTMAVDVAK